MTKRELFLGLLMAGVAGGASAQKLKDAQDAMQVEQYDKAKTILQELIQKKPKDADNYFYLGQIHLVNDKVDSAQIVFQQGAESNPKDVLNTVGLGAVELQKGNKAAAETKFTQATSNLGKKDYLPLYFTGRAYIAAPTPDYTKAIEYLTQAKEKNAKDAMIPNALGDAYAGLRESNQAYISYRDALSLDESLIAPKIGQAVISRWAQAYDVVLEDLNNLIAENPSYAPLYRELAETYYYSSLKAAEEDYREINQKGLDAYKKYLEVSGDQSIDAQVRYADFLVYTGNYEELKTVAQRLSSIPGVDPKVYRYLGYITFLQEKDYAKASEYMNKLFEEVDESRLIGRDYLIAGLAAVSTGDEAKGTELLKKAVEKQGEDEDLDSEIAETAFSKYQDGEQDIAMKIFAIPAANPESDYYYDSNYYLGTTAYTEGSKLYIGEGGEPADNGAANLEAARPYLEKAIKAFDVVIGATKKETVEKYKINAIYFKGLSELALDNLQFNPEEHQGLFVPTFEQLITLLTEKGELEEVQQGYLVDAYNYLGYHTYFKGDMAKAKSYFEKSLEIDPTNETATAFVSQM